MIPSSVKERLLRLQHENKKLKSALNSSGDGGGGAGSNVELLQTMIEDLKVSLHGKKPLSSVNYYILLLSCILLFLGAGEWSSVC